MARRTVALYEGEYIGIEMIYTVIAGRQINIPDKFKELREKSRRGQLFCPCGCGVNLILVAGDRNLREQHFRLKDGQFRQECHMVTEGKTSVNSKIVLKCWLDEKIAAADMASRVAINDITDIDRKYEFTFLSKSKGIAISSFQKQQEIEEAERQKRKEEFKKALEARKPQQDIRIFDDENNRWIQCEFCRQWKMEREFVSYGGVGRVNLGTCKDCSKNNPEVKKRVAHKVGVKKEHDPNKCPQCGCGALQEKNGPYGKFLGCSNYPKCRHTRRLR